MNPKCSEWLSHVNEDATDKGTDKGTRFDSDGSTFASNAGFDAERIASLFLPPKDIDRVLHAVRTLDFGGVIVNDMPTFRADHMPYGGNKQSGLGREGVRFALEEMTNVQMVAIRTTAPQ